MAGRRMAGRRATALIRRPVGRDQTCGSARAPMVPGPIPIVVADTVPDQTFIALAMLRWAVTVGTISLANVLSWGASPLAA